MSQPSWPAPPQPPPPRKPRTPLLLGIVIGAVVPFFGLVPPLLFRNGPDVVGMAPVVWVFMVLLGGAALLFSDDTRRWGVGILIGLFGMLIVGAGACVTLFIVFLSTYQGG